jgi:hypothetical protein
MSVEETASIEGTLLMLDGKTPHIRVLVQAICEGQVIQATLSDYSGLSVAMPGSRWVCIL